MGRISLILSLKELPLYDCNMFWNNTLISSFEKLKILSITGGIPRYLEEIIPSFSAEQNITNLCFKSSGVLFRPCVKEGPFWGHIFFRADYTGNLAITFS